MEIDQLLAELCNFSKMSTNSMESSPDIQHWAAEQSQIFSRTRVNHTLYNSHPVFDDQIYITTTLYCKGSISLYMLWRWSWRLSRCYGIEHHNSLILSFVVYWCVFVNIVVIYVSDNVCV